MAKDSTSKKKKTATADKPDAPDRPAVTPRLKQRYRDEVAPRVAEKFGIQNRLALPRFDKIVINCGMGKELDGTKVRAPVRDQVLADLAQISGQKAVMVRARKSVSNFKVRSGYQTHARVTLRGDRMWEFLDRLVTLAIPRVKDFRGLPRKFDKAGNYSMGIREQGIFPEINMAEAQYAHGMNVNIVLNNSSPERSAFVLTELGMPFQREGDT
jgi:large subunit ribosomal protein L5